MHSSHCRKLLRNRRFRFLLNLVDQLDDNHEMNWTRDDRIIEIIRSKATHGQSMDKSAPSADLLTESCHPGQGTLVRHVYIELMFPFINNEQSLGHISGNFETVSISMNANFVRSWATESWDQSKNGAFRIKNWTVTPNRAEHIWKDSKVRNGSVRFEMRDSNKWIIFFHAKLMSNFAPYQFYISSEAKGAMAVSRR
jgi:hypothetical protein